MTLLRDDAHAMTAEDFQAFTETRPDGERWELSEGEPILNPSPSFGHQRLVGLLVARLLDSETGASWQVLPGIGAKLSDITLSVPDVMIRPRGWIEGSLLRGHDRCLRGPVSIEYQARPGRKRRFYATVPSCQSYVVLAHDRIDVRCYDRSSRWAERRLTEADATLDLDHLGVSLDLARLYRDAFG